MLAKAVCIAHLLACANLSDTIFFPALTSPMITLVFPSSNSQRGVHIENLLKVSAQSISLII